MIGIVIRSQTSHKFFISNVSRPLKFKTVTEQLKSLQEKRISTYFQTIESEILSLISRCKNTVVLKLKAQT